jgi:hypothetical protein
MVSIPVAIPTRRHARSREPRPAHRRRRRRGSYCAPLPPRLNPSPNPWTMASSKLLSSNGSNPSEEAEAKTCSTTTNNTKVAPNHSPEQLNTGAVVCPPVFQVAVRTRGGARGQRATGRSGRFSLGARRLARVGVVAVPVTISTVRERKGLAFPVPRAILLASFI